METSCWATEAAATITKSTRALSWRFVWIFGILLPLAAIAFEAGTAVLTEFRDPMPSASYVFLLLAVPACNWMAWRGLKRDDFHRSRLYAAMTGFSAAIALFYAAFMIPILPLALLCLIVLLGILGFAPILSLWTAIRLMRAWAGFAGWRPIVLGAIAGLASLILLAAPAVGLRAGSQMVDSQYGWMRDTGYGILRTAPVRRELLESCEWIEGNDAANAIALLTGRGKLLPEQARELYYRATGQSYDRQPVTRWRRRAWMQFDEQRGQDRVGRTAADVQLTASRLDGKVDARGATGYLEWTMVFHNSGTVQQEARSEIALPAGGVVSRVTLWIDGEEHEAAYGGAGQVRKAYREVVQARRDPLLVTSTAPGRVMVQCFPVPPGRDMKIRLGMTAPLIPEGLSDRGILTLPELVTQNFASDQPAWLWLESPNPIETIAGKFDAIARGGDHVLRGPIRPRDRAAVQVAGLTWPTTWTADVTDNTGRVVRQSFSERAVAAPDRVVVVDGSESTRAIRDAVNSAVPTIPAGIERRVVLATRTGVAALAPSAPWGGGVDAVPALEEALNIAGGVGKSAVVWIAGDQPVKMASTERIHQILERGQGEIRLAVFATGSENVILRELNGLPGVDAIPPIRRPADDLRRFFAQWQMGARERIAGRRAVSTTDAPGDALRASSHVVRLWAAEEAARVAESDRGLATAVAAAHQIVTPWTGAVVLETAQQYQQNGLEPVKSGSTPAVTPEPGTWILMGIGVLGLLIWRARCERRRCA